MHVIVERTWLGHRPEFFVLDNLKKIHEALKNNKEIRSKPWFRIVRLTLLQVVSDLKRHSVWAEERTEVYTDRCNRYPGLTSPILIQTLTNPNPDNDRCMLTSVYGHVGPWAQPIEYVDTSVRGYNRLSTWTRRSVGTQRAEYVDMSVRRHTAGWVRGHVGP